MSNITHLEQTIPGVGIIRTLPQATVNNYPVRSGVLNKAPEVSVIAHVEDWAPPAPFPASLAQKQRNSADILDLITLAGAVCMFSTSTALTGNMTPSTSIDVCALSGIVGTLFAGFAASLTKHGAYKMAMRLLLLSGGCAMGSAMCLVAGTQTWVVTMLTGGTCLVTMLMVILRCALVKNKVTDAEAAMYPPPYRRDG